MAKKHVIEMESIEYIKLPAVRFIGKDVMAKGKKECGEKYPEMIRKSVEFIPILDAMADYATNITDLCALKHHDHGLYNKSPMHYIVGKFMKENTPVPEGFDYWDIPESSVAFAIVCGELTVMIDKGYFMTRDKILADGLKIPYPKGYFHAEVYIKENIFQEGAVSKMGYLFSCCSDQERKELSGQEAYPS
jgi:hypothetical protein